MHITGRDVAARVGVLATVTALVAGSLGVAAPAQADTVGFRDARGDMGHPADIHVVRVVNEKMVRVKIRHQNLTPRGNKSASVFVDTDAGEPGPEFVFAAGIFAGTDYQLVRMRGWKRVGDPLACAIDLGLDYRRDVSQFKMHRRCLGHPTKVRVAVKVTGETAGQDTFTADWLHGRREFTRSVARG